MPTYGSSSKEDKQVDTEVDANASSITTALITNDAKHIGLFVKNFSGAHTTHVVTCQIYDGVNWWDTAHSVTGEGFLDNELCVCEQVRAKVTTLEGGASKVDITIIIK